jgi:hypothetical protein
VRHRLVAVVWAPGDPPPLPAGVEEVEALAPLPVTIVSGREDALAGLRELSATRSVTNPPSEALAIVRGIARVIFSLDQLAPTAVNGYPGRLPNDAGAQGAVPAYPILASEPGYLVDFDPEIRRIVPMCKPAAVNLSLEHPPWLRDELSEDDPLAVAVAEAARRALVVVSAGNEGLRMADDTRSALARLPNTVAVGATTDEAGTTLDPRSATGPAGGEGPFVCAWAQSIHERPRRGTSFAAPRVTRELEVLTGFLRTVFHAGRDDGVSGIPLCGVGFVDDGRFNEVDSRLPIPAYPLEAGVDASLVRAALATDQSGAVEDTMPSLEMVLVALGRSARQIRGCARHEVGHGFVSEQTTLEYLRGFDGHELMHLLGNRTETRSNGADSALDRVLTTPDLERAASVWAGGALWVYWDYRGETGAVA